MSKVIFYLYTDVFKDYGFSGDIFKGANDDEMTFQSFYNADGSPIANDPYGFYEDQIPSLGLTMTDGAITCAPYSFNLDEAGSQYMTVVASDVFAIQGNDLYFLIEEWPASFRSGEFTFTKTSNEVPSTQAKSCGTPNAVLAPFATSVVLN